MNSEEYEREILKHERYLYKYAYVLCGNYEDSKDLVQETYYKLFKYKSNYIDQKTLKGFIHKVLKNIFIDTYRNKSRRKTHKIEFNNLQKFECNLFTDDILSQLNKINPTNKDALIKWTEGFSYKEIANILNISDDAVKTKILRGRKELINKLSL